MERVTNAWALYADDLRKFSPPGIELAALLAVIAVEASGQGLDPTTGKPIIRFEVHKFYTLWGAENKAVFNQHFRFNSVEVWKDHAIRSPSTGLWTNLHRVGGTFQQAQEWMAFDFACTLDRSAAIRSTSWGAGQIMGFHYQRLGYATPDEMMAAAFSNSSQIQMLCEFINSDKRLIDALKSKSWATFARYYNGSGQVPVYSKLLADAYASSKSIAI